MEELIVEGVGGIEEHGIYGLPWATGTMLALLSSGVIVPAMTALLAYDGLPSWLRHWLPIMLSIAAAGIIVILQHDGPLAHQLLGWLGVAATITGVAQTIYAAMPKAWKALEESTNPDPPAPGRRDVTTNDPPGT